MKTSIKIGAALLLAGILIATSIPRKAGAQMPSKPQHGIVILTAQDDVEVTGAGTPDAMYLYKGFYVLNLDASPGVPKLATIYPQSGYQPTTNRLPVVLAGYFALNFVVTFTDGRTWVLQN